jgi:ABC-type hemin transport system ATPase subunit
MAEAADIELIAVVKRYGATTAVDGIDLKIPGGSYCCLLGPLGCGKTTTLRLMAGHERIVEDGAEAVILGCAGMADLAASLSRRTGVPTIDGVGAAVKLVEALVGLGLRTSESAATPSPCPSATPAIWRGRPSRPRTRNDRSQRDNLRASG